MLNPLVLISGAPPEYFYQAPLKLSCSGDGVEKLRATSSLPSTLKTQMLNEGECPMNESPIRLVV